MGTVVLLPSPFKGEGQGERVCIHAARACSIPLPALRATLSRKGRGEKGSTARVVAA
ncbi:hypothetical protein GCM10027046_23750 [Uliginosibacterium flavum]